MNGTKKWYESKLLWLNVFLSLAGVSDLLAGWLEAGNVSPAGVAMLVSGILGVILRVWFTDTPIE